MINLAFCFRVLFCTSKKAYYPLFLSPTYEPLQYSQSYLNAVKQLKIDSPNAHQINEDALPKFLSGQIKDDKIRFIKEKQFLFIGRSNSGKSTLINAIFKDKTIARKAKAAGTTKFLHFHQIKNANAYVVDAPGYGFAEMNKKRRNKWFGLVQTYAKISSRLSQIYLCINFEHGLKNTDVEVLKRISKFNVDIQLIMNKIDKVHEKKFMSQLKSINDQVRRLELPNINNRIIACSSKTNFGIQMLRCRIIESIEQSRQRNIDCNQDLLLEYLKDMRVSAVDINTKQKQLTRPHMVRKLIYNSKLTKYLI